MIRGSFEKEILLLVRTGRLKENPKGVDESNL